MVHACLEGPEAGVYYRGKSEIINGYNQIVLLPDYVSKIATNLTLNVTPIYNNYIGCVSLNVSEVVEHGDITYFTVYGPNCKFYWTVFGERTKIDVEPSKNEFELRGEGPYKYIVKTS